MTNTLQRLLSIGAVLVLLAIAGAVLLLGDQNNEPIGCTMEAKICPDGTAVGRVGPNCEFAECPNSPRDTEGPKKNSMLYVGESVTYGGVMFTIEQVEDSRCAIGVVCIWQGEARVKFTASKDGVTEQLELVEREIDAVFNIETAIQQVKPYPEEGVPVKQQDYQVYISFRKL